MIIMPLAIIKKVFSIKKRIIVRESLIILMLLGSGSLLVYVDCLKSRYTSVNLGVATRYYVPTLLGEIGIVIVCLYPLYLLFRLIIWGVRKGLKKFMLFCLAALLCFFSAGCYETKNEIITASQAVRVEGFPQSYDGYTISAVTGNNDYRYLKPAENNFPAESGYLRLVPLKENIYIAQIKDDDYWSYMVMFMRISEGANGKKLKMIFPRTSIDPLRYGVNLKIHNLFNLTLSGSSQNIMNFLKAHVNTDFTDESPEVNKIKDKILNAVE